METEDRNTQIQKHSGNGTSLQKQGRSLLKLGGLINKARALQGWNILGPADTAPVAGIWAEQLDRCHVPDSLCDELLNRCIDFRRQALINGGHVPALSVELFLAMYEMHKQENKMSDWEWQKFIEENNGPSGTR